MAKKNYLSNKKTTSQNISMSPALKDWLKRYVKRMIEIHPDKEEFRSISAFVANTIERLLDIFTNYNITLEELITKVEPNLDDSLNEFLKQFFYSAFIPLHDAVFKAHRYSKYEMGTFSNYFTQLKKIYLTKSISNSLKVLEEWYNRAESLFKSSKIVENSNLYLPPTKEKFPKGIFEYRGKTYRNLHYENCKFNAALLGFFGIKIKNFTFNKESLYSRFELQATELFFSEKPKKKERQKLIDANLDFLTNMNEIVEDKDHYLWYQMANDKNVLIDFKDETAREKWIKKVENDLVRFGTMEELPIKMLKFFNQLHWIHLNESSLSFQLNILETQSEKRLEYLLKYISKFFKIRKKEGTYYLEQK
ncbi:MAG: hypothetical protein ACTSR8_07040 [Promethearchaeota archaeon]